MIPQWEGSAEQKSFLVRLSLKGLDRLGLLNEISRFISLIMGVNMRSVYLNTEGGIFEGYIDLYVHDKDVLERVIKKLSSIEGIQSVIRIDI